MGLSTTAQLKPQPARTAKVLIPVRYSAWLTGDIGRSIERAVVAAIAPTCTARVTRLSKALLVEADEEPGILLEAAHRAALDVERGVAEAYPVFHYEMGPVWTGTLQAVFG